LKITSAPLLVALVVPTETWCCDRDAEGRGCPSSYDDSDAEIRNQREVWKMVFIADNCVVMGHIFPTLRCPSWPFCPHHPTDTVCSAARCGCAAGGFYNTYGWGFFFFLWAFLPLEIELFDIWSRRDAFYISSCFTSSALCIWNWGGGKKMCFLFSAWNVPRRGVIPDWECVC